MFVLELLFHLFLNKNVYQSIKQKVLQDEQISRIGSNVCSGNMNTIFVGRPRVFESI